MSPPPPPLVPTRSKHEEALKQECQEKIDLAKVFPPPTAEQRLPPLGVPQITLRADFPGLSGLYHVNNWVTKLIILVDKRKIDVNCSHEPQRVTQSEFEEVIEWYCRGTWLWNMEHLDLRLCRAQPPFKYLSEKYYFYRRFCERLREGERKTDEIVGNEIDYV